MHNKLRILFVIVAVFMILAITTSISAYTSRHRDIHDGRRWMSNDVTDAFYRTRWSYKDSNLEGNIRYWKEKVNKTSEDLIWKWCEGREEIQWMRERHWFFGNLSYENGLAAGKFVRFMFNESNGDILAYTLKRDEGNISVFDSITLDSFIPKEDPVVLYGAHWLCRGENITLDAYDNPTAFFKASVNQGDNRLVFDLGSNFSANRTRSENVVTIEGDLIRGKLIVFGPMWWRNNKTSNITIEEGFVNVSLTERFSVLFTASTMSGFGVGISDEFEDRIEDAISKCRIGARIFVQMNNRTHNGTHCMAYSDIDLHCKADRGIIEVNVSSEEEGGQTIVIDVDNETFNIININRIQVKYDGEIIGIASNYSDILNPDDDDGKAEYLVVVGSDGIQILVSIPSFSEHIILITEITEAAGSVGDAPGFEFIIILLAIVLLLFIKRKKE